MKIWPSDLDMRGKRVRLNDDTVVEIPADADRHDQDRYIYYKWCYDHAYQNVNDDIIDDSDIVEILDPITPDNAGAEKRPLEGEA